MGNVLFRNSSAIKKINVKHVLAAGGTRRFKDKPMVSPPAWATATAYIIGQQVVNDGNIYTCVAGGISSSAPTGTGLFTDGSLLWYYVSPTFVSDDPATIISSGTAAPTTLYKFYRFAGCTFDPFGATANRKIITGDNWYTKLGVGWTQNTSGIVNKMASAVGICFKTDAPEIVLARDFATNFGIYIEVDGKYLTPGVIKDITSGVVGYHKITFPTRKLRKILIRPRPRDYSEAEASVKYIKGFFVDNLSSVYPVTDINTDVKVFMSSDSFGIGEYSMSDSGEKTCYARAWNSLGFDNLTINAQSGSGYTVAGTGTIFGSESRIAMMQSASADIIHAPLSINDSAATQQPALVAAVMAYLDIIRGINPYVLIVLTGIIGKSSATMIANETAILTAAAARNDPNLLIIPAMTDPLGAWSDTDNNASIYFHTGNTHPNPAGHEYLGGVLETKIKSALLAWVSD